MPWLGCVTCPLRIWILSCCFCCLFLCFFFKQHKMLIFSSKVILSFALSCLPLFLFNHLIAMKPFQKRPIKVRNWKPLSLFVCFFALACETIFIKTHSTENRCYRTGKCTVYRYVRPCIFQPEKFTDWSSEGVNVMNTESDFQDEFLIHLLFSFLFFSWLLFSFVHILL